MDSLFDDLIEYSNNESTNKVQELQSELQEIQESNPYNIDETLKQYDFINTQDAIYRLYVKSDKNYYLKIERKAQKKFTIKYCWCEQTENGFKEITPTFNSTQTINENVEKRNKKLGQYTKDYNIPRGKRKVAITFFKPKYLY